MAMTNNIDAYSVPQVQLAPDIYLSPDANVYVDELIADLPEIKRDDREDVVERNKIAAEWFKAVYLLEIHTARLETDIAQQIKKVINSPIHVKKEVASQIIDKLLKEFGQIQQQCLHLRTAYPSIKSRNIAEWKSLTDRVSSLNDIYISVQQLIKTELDEKKAFEVVTNIGSAVSSRHARNLQRRRAFNAQKQVQQTEIPPIKIVCEHPLSMHSGNTMSVMVDDQLINLNQYYRCFYSCEEWADLLNTLIGVPIQYNWKENDDWTPGRAYIDKVSVQNFISIDSYQEMQKLFINVPVDVAADPDHTLLYGDESYVKSSHDLVNCMIPVATDPFFLTKWPMIKSHLGHMIAGSSFAFANRHLLIYVAVICQCLYQSLKMPSEKLDHIIYLLLRTFSLLVSSHRVVFDKAQNTVSDEDILYNIAIGNTAPYLFNSMLEPAVFCLIARDKVYVAACAKFGGSDVEIFRQTVWKMVLRSMLITSYEKKPMWEELDTWNLPSVKYIEEQIYERGPECLVEYMMDKDKVMIMPDKIIADINQMIETQSLFKIFSLLISWSNRLTDKFFAALVKYSPIEWKEWKAHRQTSVDKNTVIDLVYYTYWECVVSGQKNCYPLRNRTDLAKVVANMINDKFGVQFTSTLADIRELNEFRKRLYETRYLPVTFTMDQEVMVNILFADAFNGKVAETEFKERMRQILDKPYCQQLDEVLATDRIDPLANLYLYCKSKLHFIQIKPTKLPYSCVSNASSPYFLQYMTDTEFSAYYKPRGFGWLSKKYRDWVADLHPFMVNEVTKYDTAQSFAASVLAHSQAHGSTNVDNTEEEAKLFYQKFSQLI